MYHAAKTLIRTCEEDIEVFPTTIGLHQGSILSPYPFSLPKDELTKLIQA